MEIYTGRIRIDTMKYSANISFDPFNPTCPHCNATMVVNPAEKGILNDNGWFYLIPLICLECQMELWIKAMPVGVTCDERFADKLGGMQ